MQKHIRELYPKWVDEINSTDYTLTLSNDMDSLLSCAFLKHHFNLDINSFYSFHAISHINETDPRESIGIDLALKNGKVFDNHMTRLNATSYTNTQSANINNVTGVHRDIYTDKFAMSTLIQLYAIYNVPLPNTIQGKLIILCCDVGFKGYYDDRYRDTFLSYLEIFGMLELVEILEMYTIQQMYEFMLRAELDLTILMDSKGSLKLNPSGNNPDVTASMFGVNLEWHSEHLGYNVGLPQLDFKVTERFSKQILKWWELDTKTMHRAYSFAFINTNTIMISLREEGVENE